MLLSVFFFVFFSSLLGLGASKASQSFVRLADFYGHVSHAKMGVEVNFTNFDWYLNLLDGTLRSANHTDGLFGTSSSLARLQATVQGIQLRHDEYQSFFSSSPVSRNKRQLGAVLGIGIGLAALYDVETLRGTVGEMQSRQNDLVRLMSCITNDTAKLTKNFKKLRGAISMLDSAMVNMNHLIIIESAVLDLSATADRYFAGLRALLDGDLSFDLVHQDVVEQEFISLREAAFNRGFETVFHSFSQVFQLPVSFYAESGVVHVIIDIPIVPINDYSNFALYHYHSLPFFLGNHLVRVQPRETLVAINRAKDAFVPIYHSQLHACQHVGHSVLCHYPSVSITDVGQCCLCAIFRGLAEVIFKACPVTFLAQNFLLERLNSTAFLAYSNESVSGALTCGLKSSQLEVSSLKVINIEPGCVFNIQGVTFVAAFDPQIRIPDIISTFSPPVGLLDLFSNSSDMISEALSHFDQVDYNALVRGGEELGQMAPWVPTSNHFWIWALTSSSLAFLSVALVFVACRGKILAKCFSLLLPGLKGDWTTGLIPRVPPLSQEQVDRLVAELRELRPLPSSSVVPSGAVPVRPGTMHEVTWPEEHPNNVAMHRVDSVDSEMSMTPTEISELDLPYYLRPRGIPEDMPSWDRHRVRPLTQAQRDWIESGSNVPGTAALWNPRRSSSSDEAWRHVRLSRPASRVGSFRTAREEPRSGSPLSTYSGTP